MRVSLPTNDPTQVLSIPKEIWRMVDYLFKFGIKEENLFVNSGLKEEIGQTHTHLFTHTLLLALESGHVLTSSVSILFCLLCVLRLHSQ